MIHADWWEYDEKQVIAYEDDASRKILSIGEFDNATTENAIDVLKETEKQAEEINAVIEAIRAYLNRLMSYDAQIITSQT